MQTVLIANDDAGGGGSLRAAVSAALERAGARVLLPPDGVRFPDSASDALLERGDVVVALGGDGTIIHTAKRAARLGKPVLGINGGRLGFMAGLEADELDLLSALTTGHYTLEQRMMLDVRLETAAGGELRLLALNEATLSRGALSHMIELEVSSDREPVLTYRADGVIVATPTGSTAYSLSAGGPIIDPAVRCMLLTPVCAHSLHARSYIFSESAGLTLRALNAGESEAVLAVDGEEGRRVGAGDRVTVTRAETSVHLIRIKPSPFYQVLNQKLVSRR